MYSSFTLTDFLYALIAFRCALIRLSFRDSISFWFLMICACAMAMTAHAVFATMNRIKSNLLIIPRSNSVSDRTQDSSHASTVY